MAAGEQTSSEYIKHHLTNLTYGRDQDGVWRLAETAQEAQEMGFYAIHLDSMGWAIGLGCVGVAGGMMANYFFIFTDVGINFALFAFVAVALGGFGSIIGCLYAGIIIGLVESLGGLLIDPSFKLLYVFVIYLLVVIYRPQGLFGRY